MTSNNSMTFNQYMNQYEVPKGRKSTNTSMCYPKKSYHIPDDKYPEFLQKYAEQVEKGTDLHLTEKPSEYSPIRVDLDFRFEPAESSSKHLYSLQNIKNIITEYCKVIKDTFQCQEIISVLQEKEESTTFRGKVKDGVHIIFPYIHISYDLQHYIREQVLKSDLVQEEFKQMKVLNKYDDIIDKAVISSNNWFLYGSKKLECHAYRVSHTFKYDGVLQSTSIPDNYIQLFSMRNMNTDNNISINQDKSDLIQEYINSKKKPESAHKSIISSIIPNIPENLDMVQKLVSCLSCSRAENYEDWIRVGWCLHNIDENLLDTWIQFSKSGSSFEEGKCEELWYKMNSKGNLTLGSLKYWAKLDNSKLYEEIQEKSVEKWVDKALRNDGSHSDVAAVFRFVMSDRVVYDTKVKSWFIVNQKNIWEADKEGIKIPILLCDEICTYFSKRGIYYNKLSITQEDNNNYLERAKQCLKIMSQLKNTGYTKSVKEFIKGYLSRNDFVETVLDNNINLFAFTNGLFDLEKKIFRTIEPTDYISIHTGYDYNPSVSQKYIDEIYDFLKECHKSEEMYEYILDILTLRLYGKNYHQEFYIFTGSGANGKSVLMNLLIWTFGKYCLKINPETLTKPKKSANETSELHEGRGVRLILTEEPDEGDKLQAKRVCEMTGDGGKVKSRGLFENPTEYKPQFGIILLCNEMPGLSKSDAAIARRLRICKFPFKFCDNPTRETHKLIDRSLTRKMEENIEYKQAFAHILWVNWLAKNLNQQKLDAPNEVMSESQNFIDECNEVKTFIESNYDRKNYELLSDADKKEFRIRRRDLYLHFKVQMNSRMEEKSFKYNMKELEIDEKGIKGVYYYVGLKKKEEDDEENKYDFIDNN